MYPVENALEMVLVFDGMGTISYANAAARSMLGYETDTEQKGGLCGRFIGDVFPGAFRHNSGGFESDCSVNGEVCRLVAYRKNFTCFPTEGRLIWDPADPQVYICMACDILEREHLVREIEQMREEALGAAKMKSEFVANVTHELRTPVNGILGNVRQLLEEETDEKSVGTLRLIERCCGDMNKLIDNILDFSKLEAGKFVLEKRRFGLKNMLDYVKAQHIGRITEKGLDFFVTVSPRVPEYVVGDELRIVQILNNLLSNALKFTAVGRVSLQVFQTALVDGMTELFFIVSDTGIGIGEEERDKLFQSFSQVDASISRKYGGTGLGLNICRQLVELMGGRIELESEKGRGSRFSFSIWVEACEEEGSSSMPADDVREIFRQMAQREDSSHEEASDEAGLRQYGTSANREQLEKNLSKLVLCVEMANWEKAEMFAETVRQLVQEAPPEVKREALKLKMAVQKENYDKAIAGHEKLCGYLFPS